MNKQRRHVLVWTAPTVAAISLPTHAQMSPMACAAPPVVSVPVTPKCAGDPPIGTAQLEIFAPNGEVMNLLGITVTTSDSASTLTLPSLPASLSETSALVVTWDGPASDAVSCLPLAEITMELEYACTDEISVFETYDVTALLAASAA